MSVAIDLKTDREILIDIHARLDGIPEMVKQHSDDIRTLKRDRWWAGTLIGGLFALFCAKLKGGWQ